MLFTLHLAAKGPIYRQIYQRVVTLIASGQLGVGARVPSIRGLAHELGLARGTVEAAYDLLMAEGYLEGKGSAGTFVSALLPVLPQLLANTDDLQPAALKPDQPSGYLPLQMGLPALDLFPLKLWGRLTAKRVRGWTSSDLAYPPQSGYAPLKAELAKYLQLARGITCAPEQIMIVAGYQSALGLLAEILAIKNHSVWLEDPGYLYGRKAWAQAGAQIVPVPVDHDGLSVAEGLRLAPNARCAVVTPAHQSPLTVSLSLSRRMALLDWAQQTQAWVIEDDYDGEYRYRGWPLPALSSMAPMNSGRCIAVGTFSKVLFPGLRLAYVVLPVALVAMAERALLHSVYQPPLLGQQVLCDFMQAGHFTRHVKKMRRRYAERRQMMVTACQQVLSEWLTIVPEAGGMHLLAHTKAAYDDQCLAQRAQKHGLAVQALSGWAIDSNNAQQGLLFGFANVVDERQAQHYVQMLAAAWAAESYAGKALLP